MGVEQISEAEYKMYSAEIQSLMKSQPKAGSKEAERLKLIGLAVQLYEKNKFHFEKPTAIEAIKFRMEEMGLNQNDLIPYLGGKNRVSEILSQKRPLTLPMIKALNKYLGIPLEILLQEEEPASFTFSVDHLNLDSTIYKEVVKKGWIKQGSSELTSIRGQFNDFLKPLGGLTSANALFRSNPHPNSKGFNETAAFLWTAKVLLESEKLSASSFDIENITMDFLKSVAELSAFEKGPLLAQEHLLKYGVKLVIVPHLTSTYIDGGTIANSEGDPVIGMSLRYDRLDSFWHTLMHELVHVFKHFKIVQGPFLDDLDAGVSSDPIEKEADQIARDIFIPKGIWRSSDALHFRKKEDIIALAKQLKINPAIIAGRIRFEANRFQDFNELIGLNKVREMFGVKWT